jgi:excisionase family DNA binding protein
MPIKANSTKLNEVDKDQGESSISISPTIAPNQALASSAPPPDKRLKNDRPLLEPFRNYTIPEAARAIGVAAITIWRALESGHLKCYRVGRRVICNGGQHLIPWLEAGGKTSKA